MPAEPVLDLQPLREQAHETAPHRLLPHGVELRLALQAPDEDLEPLAERVVAEVAEARLVAGVGDQLVVLPHVPPSQTATVA